MKGNRSAGFIVYFYAALSSMAISAEQPNMVVVLVDDHAYEAISAYESHLKDYAQTPTIDRLFHEGMRFDNMTVPNSICSPSRAAILTGQFSHVNGVLRLNGRINEDSPQYPAELQKLGYQTFLVGKWHLENSPKGYDKHMTVKGQGAYFDPQLSGSEGSWKREGYSTDVYTDIALDWLESRDRKKPFLLSLQFKAPHHDYGHAERYNNLLAGVTIPEPPTLYEDVRREDSNLKKLFIRDSAFHMLHSGRRSYYERHQNDQVPDAMGQHDAKSDRDRIRAAYQHQIHKYIRCIRGNDDNLKRVLGSLEAQGILDDTVVIYTSDQGYWLGQHGLYDKRLILESSVRTPFLIRYPRMIMPASVNADLTINIDVAPTLLELAGAEIPPTMQGRSLVPLLKGEPVPPNWRTSQLYTYWGGTPKHYGVRDKRFTYVESDLFSAELFDRKLDPQQQHNVAGNLEYATVLRDMKAELRKQIENCGIGVEELPGANVEADRKVIAGQRAAKGGRGVGEGKEATKTAGESGKERVGTSRE
ncbi:sulfatase family protein [Novipirellula artificiosorum]|nr:sulfatase [Novipirellula artificiosorum]